MGTVQNLHVLAEPQGQTAEPILAFQADEMLDRIVVRMINVKKNTGRVIQPNVIAIPPHNVVAVADRDGRLDRHIPIVNTIEMREQNIIVVNSANRQAHTPLKTLRCRRNAGPSAINLLPTFRRRWWYCITLDGRRPVQGDIVHWLWQRFLDSSIREHR